MKRKRVIIPAVILTILILLVLAITPYYRFLKNKAKISPLKTLLSANSLRKVDNTVNILILGIPGGRHDGPNLSDSIIVLSYNMEKNRLITINIPRDIWSNTLQDKINSAYAYGEDKKEKGGLKLAKAEVSAIVGMPIQYAAVLNFSNFRELIDFLGGIEVEVERSFTDRKFPIEGKENDECGIPGDQEFLCRYETVSFKKGEQRMNGATALKFVRSRNAVGAEGSDFARSKRQQLVIGSLKDKIVKTLLSFNLKRIEGLYDKLDTLVMRDITNQQVAILGRRVVFGKDFYQKNFHLDEELFEVPDPGNYYGKYVLIPQDNEYELIYKYVECLLEKESETSCKPLVDKGEEDN